jgi:hypothetical protein
MSLQSDCVLSNTKLWFEKAVPQPSLQNFTTQVGVHFEEVGEMIDEITGIDLRTESLLVQAREALSALGDHLKANSGCISIRPEDEVNFLDAICDQVVTGTGVAHMLHYDMLGAMTAVNESNFSKFVDGQPIFNENMKIMKGPDFFKPVLSPYIKR